MSFTCFIFFFNDTPTTEIYTLSLHDALPISLPRRRRRRAPLRHDSVPRQRRLQPARHHARRGVDARRRPFGDQHRDGRSEEHTSELQSLAYLVCRLLLEKKKTQHIKITNIKK